ncbi:MAG: NAD(P)-binding protein [Rubrivivax sp.]
MASRRKASAGPAAAPAAVRVAIVGGGCAGMAAAWQLQQLNRRHAADPAAPRYEIDVYESSWRLGGKGASVRDRHGRIVEHGLHVWLGFYENAFRLMREAYARARELGLGPQAGRAADRLLFGRVEDAFGPEPHIGVASRRHDGDWQVWSGLFPPMPGQPGEPLDAASSPFSWLGYGTRALGLVRALLQSLWTPPNDAAAQARGQGRGRSPLDEAVELDFSYDPVESPSAAVERLAQLGRLGALTGVAALLQGVTMLESFLRESNPQPQLAPRLFRLAEAVARQARRLLTELAGIDETLRRKTEIVDLVLTILVGLLRDRVVFSRDGLERIDHIDYREWLEGHGATRGALASPLVTGIYDLVFAYRDGRHDRPALSAAQAVRGALRMFFTYRGSMFWRMNGGMGDVVFAPLFRVLAAEGVRFHFRHTLERIDFDGRGQRRRVRALRLRTVGAPGALQPQLRADRSPEHWPLDESGCWLDEPDSPFPPGATAGRRVLAEGEHFDAVVFACGIDPFVRACGETAPRHARPRSAFFKALPAWDAMRTHVATVATRSAQVWLDQDLEQLGWDRGPVIVAGLGAERPDTPDRGWETWADMTHLLATEAESRRRRGGAAAGRARSLAYFCSVLPDAEVAAMRRAAQRDLKAALESGMRPYWPAAWGPGRGGALAHLVSADGQASGAGLLAQQVLVVNHAGSERYTQALPGSGRARLSPLDPTLENATIAGDWTDAGFNGGCVETAVMSGWLAAHAISGALDLNTLVGYHHP